MLSGEIARRYGSEGLPDNTIRFHFTGSAGQSFGAFVAKGVTLTLEETLAEINERDQRDSQRADSPLVRAEDAVNLDTSGKTIEEVLQEVVMLVEKRQKEEAESAKDE